EILTETHSLTSLWYLPVLFLGRLWAEMLFRALQPVTKYKRVYRVKVRIIFPFSLKWCFFNKKGHFLDLG
ncbi:MAG: hypothetical protein II380_05425, partial [Prevotella sp.]|nr:hypothetical protein [Prevotella sp.]